MKTPCWFALVAGFVFVATMQTSRGADSSSDIKPASIADTPPVTQAPILAKGDRWLYHRKDLIENRDLVDLNFEVSEIDGSNAWVTEFNRNGRWWLLYDNLRGQIVESRIYDLNYENRRGRLTRAYSKDEDTFIFQFPMSVGREYKFSWDSLTSNGELTGVTKMKARIEAWEKVMTAAGEYDAYRIVLKGYARNFTTGQDEDVEDSYWWSPQAKRAVLSEHKQWNSSQKLYIDQRSELGSFSPGK